MLLLSFLLHGIVKSQTGVSIPAFTAYAVPVEKSNEDDESNMFSLKDGLHNWIDTKQKIQFFFKLRTTGRLSLSLKLKTNISTGGIMATIAGKSFNIMVPKSAQFKLVKVGAIDIRDTGFYTLTLAYNPYNSGQIGRASCRERV